jgi:hypothetical protein
MGRARKKALPPLGLWLARRKATRERPRHPNGPQAVTACGPKPNWSLVQPGVRDVGLGLAGRYCQGGDCSVWRAHPRDAQAAPGKPWPSRAPPGSEEGAPAALARILPFGAFPRPDRARDAWLWRAHRDRRPGGARSRLHRAGGLLHLEGVRHDQPITPAVRHARLRRAASAG